jgi:hypothetical protein
MKSNSSLSIGAPALENLENFYRIEVVKPVGYVNAPIQK